MYPTNDAATGARANNTFEILVNRYDGAQIEQYINGALTDIKISAKTLSGSANVQALEREIRSAASTSAVRRSL